MRIIDLSVPLVQENPWAPKGLRVLVRRRDHKKNGLLLRLLFGIMPSRVKTRLSWADEVIELNTHGTTHLDAPYHYAPTSEGRPARTVDQIPLEWFFGDGVVLDMRHKQHGELITGRDVQEALRKIAYTLKSGDIVLIQTGGDRLLGTKEYYTTGPGMSAETTEWLIDQGVRVMGIDQWGWDLPLGLMAKRAKESGRYDLFWQAHLVGVEKEYCHMERLCNLDKLPPSGFRVACFPLKVAGGSAGPVRAVAILEE